MTDEHRHQPDAPGAPAPVAAPSTVQRWLVADATELLRLTLQHVHDDHLRERIQGWLRGKPSSEDT